MKNSIIKNLNSLGFSIPVPSKPVGKYVPYIKEKKLLVKILNIQLINLRQQILNQSMKFLWISMMLS